MPRFRVCCCFPVGSSSLVTVRSPPLSEQTLLNLWGLLAVVLRWFNNGTFFFTRCVFLTLKQIVFFRWCRSKDLLGGVLRDISCCPLLKGAWVTGVKWRWWPQSQSACTAWGTPPAPQGPAHGEELGLWAALPCPAQAPGFTPGDLRPLDTSFKLPSLSLLVRSAFWLG